MAPTTRTIAAEATAFVHSVSGRFRSQVPFPSRTSLTSRLLQILHVLLQVDEFGRDVWHFQLEESPPSRRRSGRKQRPKPVTRQTPARRGRTRQHIIMPSVELSQFKAHPPILQASFVSPSASALIFFRHACARQGMGSMGNIHAT